MCIRDRCTQLFDKRTQSSLKPINASAPCLRGLPKVYKQNTPIRPLVNFTTAPGYKIAKTLVKIIRDHTNLENNRIVKSNKDFIKNVNHVTIQPNHKLVSVSYTHLDVYKRQHQRCHTS